MKHDSLTKFFESLLDGTADLSEANEEAAKEEFVPDPVEVEIQKKQEAEMLKLAHGGFADMIDFEKAVKEGSAKNFHASNGYPGMMGGSVPDEFLKNSGEKKEEADAAKASESAKEVVQESSSSASSESSELPKTKARMPVTGEGGKIIAEPTQKKKKPKAKDQPKTGADEPFEVETSTLPAEPTEAKIVEEIVDEVIQAEEPEVPAEAVVDEFIVEKDDLAPPPPVEGEFAQPNDDSQVPLTDKSKEEHVKDEL